MEIKFCWWNLHDFSHFDEGRVPEKRWPGDSREYKTKFGRVVDAFNSIFDGDGRPDILALAEVTQTSVKDLRDLLFPDYEVFSLDLTPNIRSKLQVAFIYTKQLPLKIQDPIVVPNTPRGTRPMAVLDFFDGKHKLRFIACHWTARFSEASSNTRSDIARYLGTQIYDFLRQQEKGVKRHLVIIGDLNEEPFGILEERLYAFRSRRTALMKQHYSDEDIRRYRLYNCSWRSLGERHPHDGTSPNDQIDLAGSYYWREKGRWFTYDQILVDGSLLAENCPFLDETSVEIIGSPVLVDSDGLPSKFKWFGGKPSGGVSDHLPIKGKIILGRDQNG